MTDKTTFIVGLHQSQIEQLSAFQHLPESWKDSEGKTYTIVETNDCKVNVINGEYSTVFDLYISFRGEAMVPTGQDFYVGIEFYRVTKDQQAAYINRIAKHEQFTNFLPMRSWSDPRHVLTNKRYLVLKPSLGARGIGQLFVDTHAISLWKVHETIQFMKNRPHRAYTVMHERLLAPADGESATPCSFSTEGEYPAQFDTLETDVSKPPNPRTPEGVRLLMESFVVEEMVENVELEFRVLTDEHGRPWHIAERTTAPLGNTFSDGIIPRKVVTGGNGPQAWTRLDGDITPAQVDKMVTRTPGVVLRENHRTEYTNLLNYALRGISAMQLPLHSVDLFITSDLKWGIFEFSCEFGKGTVDPVPLTDHAKKFIENTCRHLG